MNYSILSWRLITMPPQAIVFRAKNSSESMKNSNMIVALRDETKQRMLRRLHSALYKDALACVQIWKSTIHLLRFEMV